jgi:hypothetical protein
MIPLSLKDIQKYLETKDLTVEEQKETNQLYIVLKISDFEFPLFIRIFEGGELLQLLAFFPCNTKSSTLGETARLLHLLNKELDVPGFGMDEDSFVVYYRCMIPVKDNQVDEALLNAYMNSIELVCRSFAPVVLTVACGGLTFEGILKQAHDLEKTEREKGQ